MLSDVKDSEVYIDNIGAFTNSWEHHAKVVWTDAMQTALKCIKALMATGKLCTYPNYNHPVDIYTDASDYQLGACIMQDGKTVAYYSKKLNSAQKNYATMGKERLSIVMTLKEFRSMLLGAVMNIHTDHKNILTLGDSSQRRLQWISYVDEYGPTLHYIKGPSNVIADTFSRMPMKTTTPLTMVGKEESNVDPLECHFSVTDDRDMMEYITYLPAEECYLNLPTNSAVDNPLDMENDQRAARC